ncbi:MAG: TOMM precursor leader peptide-binding protein [Chthoniobacterales bacterium]
MSSLPKPRIKRHFSIVAHSADVVELRHGAWNAVAHTLEDETKSGRLLRLLRRIDGSSDAAQIGASENVPLGDVEDLLSHLTEIGVLEFGVGSALDFFAEHAAAHLAGRAAAPVQPPVPPIVVGDDGALAAHLITLLGAHSTPEVAATVREDLVRCARASYEDGITFEEAVAPFSRWSGHFVIYASASVNPLELRGFNRVCLHHRVPCIAAAVDGPFLLVGPMVIPARTACLECLEMRVLMNLRQAADYQAYKVALLEGRASGATAPLDGVLAALLASLVSVEALNFALAGTSFTVGKVLCVHLPTMEFVYNEVLRVPGCVACGSAPERDDRELYFDIRALLQSGR